MQLLDLVNLQLVHKEDAAKKKTIRTMARFNTITFECLTSICAVRNGRLSTTFIRSLG